MQRYPEMAEQRERVLETVTEPDPTGGLRRVVGNPFLSPDAIDQQVFGRGVPGGKP